MPRAQLTPNQRQFLTDLLGGHDVSPMIDITKPPPESEILRAEAPATSRPSTKASSSTRPRSLFGRLIDWLVN